MKMRKIFISLSLVFFSFVLFSQPVPLLFNSDTIWVHPTDNSDGIVWTKYYTTTGATSNTDGILNTKMIVADDDNGAAHLCDTLNSWGYNDWYLPAKDELDTVFSYKDSIGGFSGSYYWNSTEHNTWRAGVQAFWGSGSQDNYVKDGTYRARCVRKNVPSFKIEPLEPLDGYSDYFNVLAMADYDNDQDEDILVATYASSIYLMENTGDSLIKVKDFGHIRFGGCDWGDYDNDGDLDILVTGKDEDESLPWKQHTVRIYKNEGSGVFTDQQIDFEGLYFSRCKWGDYDNDGDLDIVAGGTNYYDEPIMNIYKNEGNNKFTNIQATLKKIDKVYSLKWADLDNDNDLDLLYYGISDMAVKYTKVYINTGDDIFAELNLSFEGCQCCVFDYNNDGLLDILNGSNIFENNGNADFSALSGTGIDLYLDKSDYIDINNDGNLDVLGKEYDDFFASYINNGDGTFTIEQNFSDEFSYGDIYRFHYNSDTKTDFIVADDYFADIYINEYENENTEPSVPVNLKDSVSGNDAFITWDQSSDNETPAEALSYNIAIGTSPDSCNIVSPMADLSTGNKYIPGYGNTWQKNNYFIRNLEPGKTYYYRVQAVDNAFMPSAFSAMDSFYVPAFDDKLNPLFTDKYSYSHASWADYDNDNDLDLLFAGYNQTYSYQTDSIKTLLYENNGDNSFSMIDHSIQDVFAGGSEWGDYDNDGDMDLLLYGYTSTTYVNGEPVTLIYRNDGYNNFSVVYNDFPGTSKDNNETQDEGAAGWHDFNHDGMLDVWIVQDFQLVDITKTHIFINKGNDVFEQVYEADGHRYFVDINNDRYIDYVTNDGVAGINNGDISFTEETLENIASRNVLKMFWGHFNNDAYNDVLLYTENDSMIIFKNNKNLTFSKLHIEHKSSYEKEVALGDFDNDGFIDILADEQLYRNNNNESWVISDFVIPEAKPLSAANSIALGDYDNDNDLDIVVSNKKLSFSDNYCELYRNNGLPYNKKPESPTGLSHQFEENTTKVILSWNHAYDKEQSDSNKYALTYNLRIGTSPGKADILSPNANLNEGFRKIVKPGITSDTSYFIQDLPEGTYYWAVQAVDNSYAGSAFSSEGSFEVRLNTLDPLSNTYCAGDTMFIPFTLDGIQVKADNQFIVQLSDPYGYFDIARQIGAVSGTTEDTIAVSIPVDVEEGIKYKVRVLSTNPRYIGCENSTYLTINPIPQPSISGKPFVCENELGVVYTTYNYPNDTYSWEVSGGAITSGQSSSNILVKWGTSGAGYVKVTETNSSGCIAKHTLPVIINPSPVVNLGVDQSFCYGDSVVLDGGDHNDHEWSNGQQKRYIYAGESGDYYVRVTDDNGCIGFSDTITIDVKKPYNEQICIVTIDTATGKNMVVWEKTPDAGTSYFNVYRENISAGNYELIGTVDFDEISVFVDTTSQPETRSYKYAITTVDSCGNESELSPYHKTMLLTSSLGQKGVNLYWSEYIIDGTKFGFESYIIYRGLTPGTLDSIDQLPSDNEIYPDINAPDDQIVYYRIAGVKPGIPCNANSKLKASAGPFSQSISNMEDNRLKGSVIGEDKNDFINVYPNPADKFVNVLLPEDIAGEKIIRIYDMQGAMVYQNVMVESSAIVDINGWMPGMYNLQIISDTSIAHIKIIIE